MRRLRALLTTYREAGGSSRGRAPARRRPRHAADRRARALRRRTAGERAAARGQRGDAGRPRGRRRGLRLWRRGGALPAARQAPPRHRRGLRQTLALAEPILAGLGFGAGARRRPSRPTIRMSLGDDAPRHRCAGRRRRGRRASCRWAASATSCGLHCASCSAPRRRRSTSWRCPQGAPFGAVDIDVAGCTLCLACVSACPTGALIDDPERPMLRFAEDACVQCGLCKATCPEKVITLRPAARFPRRHRQRAGAQGGGAVPLHPLRQAVRRQEHDRARRRQARRQALDVPGSAQRLEVIKMCDGLPGRRRHRAAFRSLRRAAAAAAAHHRGLSARARGARAAQQAGRVTTRTPRGAARALRRLALSRRDVAL